MFLRRQPEGFVSGEEISRQLAVSRTAVWKHIQSLKADGYQINAHPHLGYQLLAVPDVLYPEEIRSDLGTGWLGTRICHYEKVDSTNRVARELAEAGAAEGTVVIAEVQENGKGRLGRYWVSPRGGVWLSLVLCPPVAPVEAPCITLLSAVAVVKAVRQVTGLAAGIKWPNDVLVNGKKVCGILTEMKSELDAINYLIAGIGVNVNLTAGDFPEELQHPATSLMLELGREVSRVNLVQELLRQFEELYGQLMQEGFTRIRNQWKELSVTLNREVKVTFLKEAYRGQAVDIDADGALLVQSADGQLKRFCAGDVTLRDGLP